jgi:hypothetical protein
MALVTTCLYRQDETGRDIKVQMDATPYRDTLATLREKFRLSTGQPDVNVDSADVSIIVGFDRYTFQYEENRPALTEDEYYRIVN